MLDRENLLARIIVQLFYFYPVLYSLSTVFVGVHLKDQLLWVGAFALTVWAFARWHNKWRWHSTPLDGLALLWLVVIAISTLANLERWRSSAISIWYVGMYLGVWIVLWDCMANRVLTRQTIVDSLLFASLVPLFSALPETVSFIGKVLQALSESSALPNLPRLSSNLGNPNILAAYLVPIIPLSAARLLTLRRPLQRLVMSAHLSVSLILLFLTYTRGGWLSIGAGAAIFGTLWLAHNQLSPLQALRKMWRASLVTKLLGLALGCLGVIALVVVSILIVRSLSESSRTPGMRIDLYEAAWQAFQERPFTGNGLLSFGSHWLRQRSVPPRQIEIEAHGLFFNTVAELGALGSIALAVSLVGLLMLLRKQWLTLNGDERLLLVGATAALSACFFITNITGFILIYLPAIALTVLGILLVALFPTSTLAVQVSRQRARWQSLAVAALWAALYLSGMWSNAANREYSAAIDAMNRGDRQAALAHIERAIALDPHIPAHHFYRGHVLGVLAAEGAIAPQAAIAAYETFLRQEPNYAPAWANLAALRWQAGEHEAALSAMQRAADRAPESWLFHYALGTYHEQLGDYASAEQAYRRALSAQPFAALYPAWQETPLRRDLAQSAVLEPIYAAARLLRDGNLSEAENRLQQATQNDSSLMVRAAIAFERGEIAQAEHLCLQVERIPLDSFTREGWRWLCRAHIAHRKGDVETYAAALAMLDSITQQPFASSKIPVSLIGILYLRFSLSQYLLPQVYEPPLPSTFYPLYDHLKALTASK